METITLKTSMHCESCVNTMKPILENIEGVQEFSFNMKHPDKLAIITGNKIDIASIISTFKLGGYIAEEFKEDSFHFEELKTSKTGFWKNSHNWKRASFNTLNCLIGAPLVLAFKTALSISFISMVGMEIVMNTTDFMITGGKAAFNTHVYLLALIPALIAGFMMPFLQLL